MMASYRAAPVKRLASSTEESLPGRKSRQASTAVLIGTPKPRSLQQGTPPGTAARQLKEKTERDEQDDVCKDIRNGAVQADVNARGDLELKRDQRDGDHHEGHVDQQGISQCRGFPIR